MRKVNLPDLPEWREPAKRETIELELRLITPMFGGGYKAREVDPLQPIRPAAIRGHLRFWWRATAGARYTSVADLHKAETELWGGASKSGRANPCLTRGWVSPRESASLREPSDFGDSMCATTAACRAAPRAEFAPQFPPKFAASPAKPLTSA